MGQGSREVKRDRGFGQVRPVLNEAEDMAQGGGVCLPPQQSLSSSTEAQAHPRATSPVFERADAPLSQSTEIRTFSRSRNAEKNKKNAKKKFFLMNTVPQSTKKRRVEGEKGLNQEGREKTQMLNSKQK